MKNYGIGWLNGYRLTIIEPFLEIALSMTFGHALSYGKITKKKLIFSNTTATNITTSIPDLNNMNSKT